MKREGRTKKWVDLLQAAVAHHNSQYAGKTKYRRLSITQSNYLDYLDAKYKVKDVTMLYGGRTREYSDVAAAGGGLASKIFKFKPGESVLLARSADPLRLKDNEHIHAKKSILGSYLSTAYKIANAFLRSDSTGHFIKGV